MDPDQMASLEASCSGSTICVFFKKKDKSGGLRL